MNVKCNLIREQITDLFNHVLRDEDKAAVQKHISECKECADYYKVLKQQDQLLDDYIDSLEADMPHRMQRALAAIGNTGNAAGSGDSAKNIKIVKRISIGIAAAAAVIIAVLGYVYFAGGLNQKEQAKPSPVVKEDGIQKESVIEEHPENSGEPNINQQKEQIAAMLADNDVAGLVDLLSSGDKTVMVLAAEALKKIGDASVLAKLEEINKMIPADAAYNPFAEAIAAITKRLELEKEKEEAVEDQTEQPQENSSDTSEEDEVGDVDNTEEGVFGLKVIALETKQAIVGAKINLSMNDNRKAEAVTDKYGRCAFEYGSDNVPSYFKVKIKADGYVPKQLSYRQNRGDEIPLNYRLELEKGTAIGGFVLTEDKQPIDGAKVEIRIYDYNNAIESVDTSNMFATSDAEGKWSCDQMPSSMFEVYVTPEHDDYVRVSRFSSTLPVESLRAQSAVVYMRPPFTVSGTVVDLDGSPVEGAKIITGDSRYSSDKRELRTDSEGKFAIEKCQPGQLVLTIIAEGFAQDMKELQVDSSLGEIEWVLEPGYEVKVRVVDSAGIVLEGAKVSGDDWRQLTSYSDRARNIQLSAKTDSRGLAVLRDAPCDSVFYDISKSSYSTISGFEMQPADEIYEVVLYKAGKITGRVYDAETGETVNKCKVTEGIHWRNSQKPTWQTHSVSKISNGRYEQKMYYQIEGFAVKVEADGYAPAETPTFYNEGVDIEYDIALHRPTEEQLTEGFVFLPDGEPASGTQIGISRGHYFMQIKNSMINTARGGITVLKSDDNGKFKMPYTEGEYILVAVHDKGVAEVASTEFAVTGQIQLQKWGKVEGTLYVGSKSGVGHEVNLECKQNNDVSNHYIDYGYLVQVDSNGKFVFNKVRPGNATLSRVVRTSENSRSYANQKYIEVISGETVNVEIGGGGRTIVGKLIIPGYTMDDFDRMWSLRVEGKPVEVDMSNIKLPKINLPERYFVMSEDEKQAWQTEWMKTEEFKECQKQADSQIQNVSQKSYPLVFKSDGSFSTDDVLPGEYVIKGDLYKKGSSDDNENRELIAKVDHSFIVPELEEDAEEEPVDIGVVGPTEESKPENKLKVGDIAPGFEIEGVNGESIKLSDYAGKFVAIEIGGPMMISDYLDKLQYLKDVYDEYAKSGKLEIISVNLSYPSGYNPFAEPMQYLIDQEDIGWVVGFDRLSNILGTSSQIIEDYNAVVYHFEFVLIAPNGRIAAVNVKPEDLMDTVAAAIEGGLIAQ